MTAPTLITPRLTLRAPRPDDLPVVAAFYATARARYIGGPVPETEAAGYLHTSLTNWATRGYGWWTVEDRASGAIAGRCGIGHPDGTATLELGWQVYDGFEGQGLAFEAATAARAHAQGVWGMRELVSMIHPDNLRSRRLATRLGARFDRMGTVEGEVCEVWLHPEAAA
ncbi:MAG: GNAT family N-acetyltransferase [Paracoccaceae bacterium]|nr:MAG: GNAT family N-acetyltransferase [Paracoccaceae bacterium]